MKILICDDEYSSRVILRACLSDYNFEIQEASNGSEALEKILEFKPDLLIIDYSMPGMSGLEVLTQMQSPALSIVLTSEGFTEDIKEELQKNANAYLVKPVLQDELIKTISEICNCKLK